MPIRENERYYLKLKALDYLYHKDYTQTETAKLLNISRVTLSKLLDEAKAEGMLRIEIVDVRNMQRLIQIEEELRQKFHLKDAALVDAASLEESRVMQAIAIKAASYFEGVLRSGMKIGVTWGRTLNAMVDALAVNRGIRDLTVYTLLGSASSNVNFQPNILAQNLLNKYSGTLKSLTAPFMCGSAQLCADIIQEPQIADILAQSVDSDVTMVGIGEEPAPGEWTLGDYPFGRETIQELIDCGAVGDICGNFFCLDGTPCGASISRRIVSIRLEDLSRHKLVVGVGGGEKKVKSVLGALNGAYLDVLITDVQTALSILKLSEGLAVE